MIYLDKDTNNTVILTLTEKSQLLNPNYIFKFTNDLQLNEVVFSAPDQSNFACRYNLFNIVETGSTFTNLTAGTVNLVPVGYWTYEIYETTGTTLSISATTGRILETGKVFVNGIDTATNPIYR